MARYSRPSVTRTYDAIQADITEATTALAHGQTRTIDGPNAEFWKAQAEGCEGLVSLWNEIVWQAVDDKKLPHWTRFAAMTTRDYYAKQVSDARAAQVQP